MSKGKNIAEEVPADGLLLQSTDAFSWKERFLERCKKWGCISILDTYPADEASLDSKFLERLKGQSTPKKAINEDEEKQAPVSRPVPPSQLQLSSPHRI